MTSVFDIELLAPILATLSAIIGLIISYRSFKNKPIQLSGWLYAIFAFYIPWGIATIFMRIASTESSARILLQISFITLQMASFSVFRFHYILIEKRGSRYFITYALAFLMSLNIALSFDPTLLGVVQTDTGYYVDNFAIPLLVLNLMMNVSSGAYATRTLFQMGVFGQFYSETNEKNIIYAVIGIMLVLILILLLVLWLIQNATGSADVTFFILLTIPVLLFIAYIYGVRPISEFIIPQRLYGFVVISPHGITVYEKSLNSKFNIELLHLLGSAIHVTNYTFKSHLQSKTSLRVAEMKDRVIMIKDRADYMFCIIADYRTYQIDILLYEFSARILSNSQFKKISQYQNLDFVDSMFDSFFRSKRVNVIK